MSSNPALAFAAKLEAERAANPIKIDRLDENILAAFPEGTEITSIAPSGASAWCQTIRIDARLPDGTEKAYFEKHQSGNIGRALMEGAFVSESAFYQFVPEHIPKPIAFGELKSEPDTWFFLAEFHDMVDELPDVQTLVTIVAKYHRDSMGKSPTGKYGFPVTTHLANVPNDSTWQESWETWYLKAMERMFEYEKKTHGYDEEMEGLFKQVCGKVIPRLLRPLETGGRSIQPCLIHSDLWSGNCMPDADTGELMLFDSCGYWGHNESELGVWRAPRYRFGRPFFKEYQKQMGMSEPHGDWDDRNALYALRFDLLVSALYPNETKFRELARSEMKRLTEKFPNGLEGYEG